MLPGHRASMRFTRRTSPNILGYICPSNKRQRAARVPELPEVETTRRGVAPHVERQKVTAVRIYDRRLRWPVPRDLPRRLVGRVVDRVDRRSKYLLFRLGADTLIVHFGMTGSLRVYGDAAAEATARSHRPRIRQRSRPALPRPAAIRRDAVVARRSREASAARGARTRAVSAGVRCGLPVPLQRASASRRSSSR